MMADIVQDWNDFLNSRHVPPGGQVPYSYANSMVYEIERNRAAIAELVGMLKICATRLEFANKHIDCEDEIAIVNAAISKYDNTTEKRK